MFLCHIIIYPRQLDVQCICFASASKDSEESENNRYFKWQKNLKARRAMCIFLEIILNLRATKLSHVDPLTSFILHAYECRALK
jgi:hypothetical protein